MKAMILAAGLGTRLSPLTDDRPKALVPFDGVPMVEGIICKLYKAGFREIIVNVHHYADLLIGFLDRLQLAGLSIYVSDETEQLMDTGGAVLQAREHFRNEKSFLVHNVDVWTNLDIPAMIRSHQEDDSLVTMAVKKRPTSRSLLFNRDGLLAGWRHNETGEERLISGTRENLQDFGNSCIQIINTEFLDFFMDAGPCPLVQMFLDLAADKRIRAFIHNEDYWYDLGRYKNFLLAGEELF